MGTSGELFVRLIQSLTLQTLRPDGIYVYIAEGYPLPERVADEVYIICKKGMVAQRSLDFIEIQSQYILFSDDDMEYASDSVEKLFDGLLSHNAECISACLFPNHTLSGKEKLLHAVLYGELPCCRTHFAYHIRRSSYYTYASRPDIVMITQSFAGGSYLILKSSLASVCFKDETWIDSFHYALGDDQLLSYKLYRYGFTSLIHFECGVIHHDAQTGRVSDKITADLNQMITRNILWYRSIYEPDNYFEKIVDLCAWFGHWLWNLAMCILLKLIGKEVYIKNMFLSVKRAKSFICSQEYRDYPIWQVKR